MAVNSALDPSLRSGGRGYAAAGLAVGLGIVVIGNVNVQPGENGGTWPGISTGALCILVTVGLFVGLLPRLRHPERATIILGALAFASVAAFWSGLTPVLAAAAAAARTRAQAPGRTARVLAGLAGVGAVLAVAASVYGSHLF